MLDILPFRRINMGESLTYVDRKVMNHYLAGYMKSTMAMQTFKDKWSTRQNSQINPAKRRHEIFQISYSV